MFRKKAFNLFFIFLLAGIFVFLNPVAKAEEETATACVNKAQEVYNKCLKEQPSPSWNICQNTFEDSLSKCKIYSPDNIGGLINPLAGKTVIDLISQVISAILGIIGSVALVLFIYSGIQWMTARGNPEQVKSASKTMLWAALGLFMIFSSYLILDLIFKALNQK